MVTYRTLAELEDAQDRESAAARQRLEHAEECLAHYRFQIHRMQESAYHAVAQHGSADDTEFRVELQRFADRSDETIHEAGRVISRHREQYEGMQREHAAERERFLAEQR